MQKNRRLVAHTALAAAGLAALALGASTAGAAPASLDRTFGEGGRVTIDSGSDEVVYAVAVQPDGKIVAAGWTGSGENLTVYRLRRGGGLDPTFGDGGTVAIPTSAVEWANAIAVQPDGKILVAGSTSNGDDAVVYRLRRNGNLDSDFGDQGRVSLSSGGYEKANAIAVQPDGKILVAGLTSVGENAVVYRLRAGGKPDPTFDGDGAVGIDSGGIEEAFALAVQPDGKIVVAGDTSVGGNAAVYRLKRNGELDPTFDGDGAVGLDSGGTEGAFGLALQRDGKIVVAGWTTVNSAAAVYRLRPNGKLDPTFDGDGAVSISAGGDEYASSVRIQPNGRIVLAGSSAVTDDPVVFRLTRKGSRDRSFGSNGVRTFDLGAVADAPSLALQRDGRIVVAGWTWTPVTDAYDAFVLRLAGDTVPTCAGEHATIVGTRRGETIRGTPGADVIAALGGNDVVRGLAGDDRLCGGKGDDRLYGGPGTDRLVGGPGRDLIRH